MSGCWSSGARAPAETEVPGDNDDNGEQDEELVILSGTTESADENVVMNSSIPVVGAIAVIGILGTALILIKRKKME